MYAAFVALVFLNRGGQFQQVHRLGRPGGKLLGKLSQGRIFQERRLVRSELRGVEAIEDVAGQLPLGGGDLGSACAAFLKLVEHQVFPPGSQVAGGGELVLCALKVGQHLLAAEKFRSFQTFCGCLLPSRFMQRLPDGQTADDGEAGAEDARPGFVVVRLSGERFGVVRELGEALQVLLRGGIGQRRQIQDRTDLGFGLHNPIGRGGVAFGQSLELGEQCSRHRPGATDGRFRGCRLGDRLEPRFRLDFCW